MKTAIKLCEYDDVLNPRYIYSLLCLAALKNKFFGICSKAFVKVSVLCRGKFDLLFYKDGGCRHYRRLFIRLPS